jgi:hypothetical protein
MWRGDAGNNIRNSVRTPAKLPCRRVVEGSDIISSFVNG